MRRALSTAAHGAIAGTIAAGCMTVLRMLAHRAGLIEQMPPQAVEVWMKDRSKLGIGAPAAADHAADQLIHLGYGLVWGGLYGGVFGIRNRDEVGRALGLGIFLWAFGSVVVFPALKIAKPPWRSGTAENAVNIGSHLVFGAVTVFLLQEFERQTLTQPRLHAHARHARVG
jgi:hypothetical protein